MDLGGDRRDAQELTRALLAELAPDSSLVAVGNIHGQGELFLERCTLTVAATDDAPFDELPTTARADLADAARAGAAQLGLASLNAPTCGPARTYRRPRRSPAPHAVPRRTAAGEPP